MPLPLFPFRTLILVSPFSCHLNTSFLTSIFHINVVGQIDVVRNVLFPPLPSLTPRPREHGSRRVKWAGREMGGSRWMGREVGSEARERERNERVGGGIEWWVQWELEGEEGGRMERDRRERWVAWWGCSAWGEGEWRGNSSKKKKKKMLGVAAEHLLTQVQTNLYFQPDLMTGSHVVDIISSNNIK